MTLFEKYGQQMPQNPTQAIRQMQSDPAGMMQRAGYSIPQGMTDARQIVNHLLQTGQVGNGKLNQLMQIARTIGAR